MSVVGFDVGNQSCFTAVAKGGGIETIANEYSDRRTPSYVSFGDKQRYIGVSAKNQERTNVKNTVSQFKRLIGKKFSDPEVQNEFHTRMIPYEVCELPDGKIGVKVQYLKQEGVFTPKQVMAMLLTYLKTTAESALSTKVADCVISVPCFYTDQQRRAMLDAASIASLNCLRLMNETTAVALAYGIYKQDLPEENAKSRNVAFIDFGHSSLQTSIAAFNKGKLKILTTASDSSLGGRDFDAKLVEYFCDDFQSRYKINVKQNKKAYLRLEAECEKLKKVMSSNAVEIPMAIDNYIEDKDVIGRMKRENFEEMCSELLIRVENCLKQLLERSGLKKEDIDAVEIVGGSTRIPAVKDIIRKVFCKEISTTLNTDEAVARGCSLQCAMLSPAFRVRDFHVQDVTSYPLNLTWDSVGGEDSGSMEVCDFGHNFPFIKQLTFYRKEAFEVKAFFKRENLDVLTGRFVVKGVAPTVEGESSKIKVKIRMDIHGIFYVSKAQMIENLPPNEETDNEPMETAPSEQDKNEKNGETTLPNGETNVAQNEDGPVVKDDETQQPMDTDQVSNKNVEQDGTTNLEESMSEATPEVSSEKENQEKKSEQKKTSKKKKPNTKTVDLKIEHFVSSLSQAELNKVIERENELISRDRQEKDRVHAMNSLEEYVLQTRNKLYAEYEKFITDEERESFTKTLTDAEDWLYDEGEDQIKSVFMEKLESLKKIGDPVALRYDEARTRPQALESLGQEIQLCQKLLDLFNEKDEKYEHLEEAEVQKVVNAVKEKSVWLEGMWNKVNGQALYEPPVVLTTSIQKEKQKLEDIYKPIFNKPKPKPKEEPPKDEKKDDENKMENTQTDTAKEEMKENEETTQETKQEPKEETAPANDFGMDVDCNV